MTATLDLFRLAPRQLQIVDLLVQGRTRKEIAALLGISLNTVKVHLHRLARRIPGDDRLTTRLVRWRLTATVTPTG